MDNPILPTANEMRDLSGRHNRLDSYLEEVIITITEAGTRGHAHVLTKVIPNDLSKVIEKELKKVGYKIEVWKVDYASDYSVMRVCWEKE